MRETETPAGDGKPVVTIIDDDPTLREALALLLEAEGLTVNAFPGPETFLEAFQPEQPGCLVLDIDMPDMNGLELQQVLLERQIDIPIVFLTGQGDVPKSVQALKSGAVEFLEKPVGNETLLGAIHDALAQAERLHRDAETKRHCLARTESLTSRERDVLLLVVRGMSCKEVARDLGISYRTVQGYRSRIMEKTDAGSIVDLVQIARISELIE